MLKPWIMGSTHLHMPGYWMDITETRKPVVMQCASSYNMIRKSVF